MPKSWRNDPPEEDDQLDVTINESISQVALDISQVGRDTDERFNRLDELLDNRFVEMTKVMADTISRKHQETGDSSNSSKQQDHQRRSVSPDRHETRRGGYDQNSGSQKQSAITISWAERETRFYQGLAEIKRMLRSRGIPVKKEPYESILQEPDNKQPGQEVKGVVLTPRHISQYLIKDKNGEEEVLVKLNPKHDEFSFQEPISNFHIQEPSNQFEEEKVLIKLNPKHNEQEVTKNQNESEEVLEKVVPKHKKRKSSRRRKKIPSLLKFDSKLKRTKKVRMKARPQLKSTSNKRRRKNKTGMKTGARRDFAGPVNDKTKGSHVIKGTTNSIELKHYVQALKLVQNRKICFKLYQRGEIYKDRLKTEEEGMGLLSQQIRRILERRKKQLIHPRRCFTYWHKVLKANSSVFEEPTNEFLRDCQTALGKLKTNLIKTLERMRTLADKHRSERRFNCGDWVCLKLHLYCQFSSAGFKNRIPSPKLPVMGPEVIVTQVLELILARRMVKRGNAVTAQILVKWRNQSRDDATWEYYEDVAQKFPAFIHEDMNLFKGGGVQQNEIELGMTVGIKEKKKEGKRFSLLSGFQPLKEVETEDRDPPKQKQQFR